MLKFINVNPCKFGTSVVSTEEQISHKHPAMRAYDLPRF